MGLCILKNKVPKNYFTFCIGKFFILIVCTKSWIYIWRIIFISETYKIVFWMQKYKILLLQL